MAQANTDPRDAVRLLIVATLLLFALVLALGAWAWLDASNKRADLRAVSKRAATEATRARREAAQTHLALCALRSDLDRRADAGDSELRRSRAFLAAHPDGIPGIPASLIRQGIRDKQGLVTGQRSSIAVLSALTCSEPPSPEDARSARPLPH